MKNYHLSELSESKKKKIIRRNNISSELVYKSVNLIVKEIKKNGLKSAEKFAAEYDGYSSESLFVSTEEFRTAGKIIPVELKNAIDMAYSNIYKFHALQYPRGYKVKTISGVNCERKFIPIENAGIYIPSGTAPLISTMLMLGIPAKIAGCKRIVAASPVKNKVHPGILYAADLCGVNEFIKIGGAQGIALMAYGGKGFKRVDKIFGPGSQYVTSAKAIISSDPDGCAIDMIAGPSEVLIIADEYADPRFIAADLLSQAEHGTDSIVILVTTSEETAKKVNKYLARQLRSLPRKKMIEATLMNSYSIIAGSIEAAFEFSNEFAPEHLIINLRHPKKYINIVKNAGSVFIGAFTPESAGDYASGTNHSLPTYGFARSSGGVSVEMFMKALTFQSITKRGLRKLSDTIINLSDAELLKAHAAAVKVRLK
jgi:histidinol dehydrogenase